MQCLPKSVETKSRRFCSVPQCNSYCTKQISLHSFPTNKKLCQKWKFILKINKPISSYMLVCSLHFLKKDFTITTASSKLRRLKKGVVPSLKIPHSSHCKLKKYINRSDRSWLQSREESSFHEETPGHIESQVDIPDLSLTELINKVEETTELTNSFEIKSKPVLITHEDKSTQTDFFQIDLILNSNEKLMAFTGVEHNTLNTYEKCVNNVAAYNGADPGNTQLKIMLVLCKLKLNLSFLCLAILFNISPKTCTRYFYAMVALLATSLKPAIYWPTKEETINNMPKCFEKFKNTRVVLDCTEIQIQKSKCLKCRILSYSNYKTAHTVKYLIGIAPSGLITYVSVGYGGRSSDKAIFNQEKLIEKLNPYDAVMVDKGILIEQECEEHFIKLIRPPFLKKQTQFSKSDAEKTASIASARVHVERAIQRIKTFKIVKNQLDWYLLPYVDNIMNIIAATVNLSPPILADDKFETHCDHEFEM